MVDRGMTPIQAIRSATTVAAELIDADDRGRLEAGLLADVIAVPGDPTADIARDRAGPLRDEGRRGPPPRLTKEPAPRSRRSTRRRCRAPGADATPRPGTTRHQRREQPEQVAVLVARCRRARRTRGTRCSRSSRGNAAS